MTTCARLPIFVCSLFLLSPPVIGAEVFEITRARAGDLPGGKEADGIIGDFVLRSDKVEAAISHNAPLRRANMSTFYGANGITPGCLYDLTLRGANNDQLTILAPLGQQGPVSWVRIVPAGELGANEAAVETVVTSELGGGIHKRFRYIVTDGVQGITVLMTLRNEGDQPVTVPMRDKWTGVARTNFARGFLWGDAVDPADKAGYALAWVKTHGATSPKSSEELAPGESITAARFVAVGTSPLDAVGLAAKRRGQSAEATCTVHDQDGGPLPAAVLSVEIEKGKAIAGYPDEQGVIRCALPVGTYSCAVEAPGRAPVRLKLELVDGTPHLRTIKLGPESAVAFHITDGAGKSIPCKAQFEGVDGTKSPNLGPQNRAHGCVDQWHSETGAFRVPLPAGKYRITVTRGMEYSHLRRDIEIDPGETGEFRGALERLIDSAGWVSTDFHNHSSPSGDNTCGTDDRVINLAAEHIEFAPTTEHNRLYDWGPHITKLGLAEELATVPGIELTGRGGHFNSFPMKPVPHTQDGGAPVWDPDPRVNALHLREHQGGDRDRWVQLNHPRMEVEFFDKNGDGKEDGGYLLLGEMIDGLETENYATDFKSGAGILARGPYLLKPVGDGAARKVSTIREFIWLQLLNRGTRVWAVAVADAHSVYGNGVGGWRTYVPSSTDAPGKIDWREISKNARSGKMVLTNGPFMEVTAGDGVPPGGEMSASGKVPLNVKIQCTDWIDIDRVQVLVNGRQRDDLNFTRQSHPGMFSGGVVKFEEVLEVPLEEDSHLIVVAMGEGFDLKTGFGTSRQAGMSPCAYNNPIFVDVDGNGFQANGDTLGFPLPVQKMSVDKVKALLDQAK